MMKVPQYEAKEVFVFDESKYKKFIGDISNP